MGDQSQPIGIEQLRLAPPPGARMLVVGGCGGIGAKLVEAARAADNEVVVMDLPRSIKEKKPPAQVTAIPVDVTDSASVEQAFVELGRHWQRFEVLVNLAGFATPRVPIETFEDENWDQVVATSLRGSFLVARRALPMIRADGGGSIVNTASGLAFHVMPGYGPYSAAKAGVIALTKVLARENAPHIRANAIAPHAVRTQFLTGGTGRDEQQAQIDIEAYANAVPMKRMAETMDVVGPLLFLAGPASRFMTGQTLLINGGQLTP